MAQSLVWWSWGPIGCQFSQWNQLAVEVRDQTLRSGFMAVDVPQVLTIFRAKVTGTPDIQLPDHARPFI
jgi:hypothetical protein